jgi:hypothetical protein
MSEQDDAEIRTILKDNGIFEAHRLIGEYKCHRRHKDGEAQDVLVRIYDMGLSNPNARYSWEVSVPGAKDPDPVSANPANSIKMAGFNPHWNMLDAADRRGKL